MTRRSELNKDALADFAMELKAHREARGWTRAELAAKIQYSESLIAAIESQERVPQKEFAAKCDEVFGLPGTFQRLEKKLHGVPFTSGIRPFAPYERITHPGLDGAFLVAEVPDTGVLAYLGDAHDGQTIEDQDVANLMRVRWDTIRTEALSGTATLDLLEKTLATLEERCQD